MTIDVARARADTPGCTNRIHFNNCGAALMPTPVLQTVKSHLDLEAGSGATRRPMKPTTVWRPSTRPSHGSSTARRTRSRSWRMRPGAGTWPSMV